MVISSDSQKVSPFDIFVTQSMWLFHATAITHLLFNHYVPLKTTTLPQLTAIYPGLAAKLCLQW
jgi:hypothetical protein